MYHLLPHRFEELQSDDDQGSDVYSDVDPSNWQQLVGRDVLSGLTPQKIKRQEVINGMILFAFHYINQTGAHQI